MAEHAPMDAKALADADRVTRAREFFEQRRWRELWQLKQQAKYSWAKLGFTSREADRIKLNKPDWL